MSSALTAQFMMGIESSALLESEVLAELKVWVRTEQPEPTALVKELRKRALLTDYQIKEISRGRGKELTLGPYKLLDLLGEGGMGRVFKAYHTRLGRVVALKVIRKEKLSKPAIIQRFHQEIRAVAQLSHMNVVLAFDADEADGMHYYAMEYVEGIDLTKIVREHGPMPIGEACDVIRQAALGLQHAYERGLVHRDVKPSNIMRTPKNIVKVLDLGLAMLNDAQNGEQANRVTQDGLVLGTPDFLAPEQAQNPTGVDIRADIYALGATLFYLLTAKVPFDGATPSDKLMQHITAPPPNLLEHRPDAPPELDGIIKWLMNKQPEDRAQTPAQLATVLTPYCPAQLLAVTPSSSFLPSARRETTSTEAIAIERDIHDTQNEVVLPVVAPVIIADAFETATVPIQPVRERRSPSYRPPAKKSSPLLRYLLIASVVGLFGFCGVGTVGYVLYSQLFQPEKPLPTEFTTAQGIQMIRLSGGSFKFGSDASEPQRKTDEYTISNVEISGPIYISRTEITNGEFRAVTGGSPAKWAPRLKVSKSAPVDSVTYEEAVDFCKKLTKLDVAQQRPGWAYRLPTEAEWEYACRAGTEEPFSFGPHFIYGRHGFFNLDLEKLSKTGLGEEDLSKPNMEKNLPYPVRSADANAFGLHDMHGNVWEWVADYYDPKPTANNTNPKGPDTGDWRVLKGGSWKETADRCRAGARQGMNPSTRKDDVGFRVVFAPIMK